MLPFLVVLVVKEVFKHDNVRQYKRCLNAVRMPLKESLERQKHRSFQPKKHTDNSGVL